MWGVRICLRQQGARERGLFALICNLILRRKRKGKRRSKGTDRRSVVGVEGPGSGMTGHPHTHVIGFHLVEEWSAHERREHEHENLEGRAHGKHEMTTTTKR